MGCTSSLTWSALWTSAAGHGEGMPAPVEARASARSEVRGQACPAHGTRAGRQASLALPGEAARTGGASGVEVVFV